MHVSIFTYMLTHKYIQEPTCFETSCKTAQTYAIDCAHAGPFVLSSCTWYTCLSVHQNMYTHANVYVYIYTYICTYSAKCMFSQNACFRCIHKFGRMQGPSCSPPVLGIHVHLCITTCTHMQMYTFTYIRIFAHTVQNACFHCKHIISGACRVLRGLLLYLVYMSIRV